jgi:TonB family protein
MRKRAIIALALISVILTSGCSSLRTYDFDEVDVKPEPVYAPKPEYPEEARSAEMEGMVVIEVLVNTDGYVARVRVAESSGYKVLDKAAKEAARDWEFIPAEKDGELVRVWVDIPFNFSLTSP